MSYKIHQGDNVATLKTLADNSVDSIITDPPYGIEFLGKDWDSNTGAIETWQQCLRVLKPGGYLLAFSAARTYHQLATNIEQVGFEIRDQLMWLYASGFPKAQDIGKAIERREGKKHKRPDLDRYEGSNEIIDGSFGSGHGKCQGCGKDIVAARILGQKQACEVEGCEWMQVYKPADNEWSGWKTALKPAHEPIVMARKPFKGSTIDNVLAHGVGALNIDESRVANSKLPPAQKNGGSNIENFDVYKAKKDSEYTPNEQGRFPANVLGEVEGYQKYFYCPKVSRRERHCGFEHNPQLTNWQMIREMGGYYIDTAGNPIRKDGDFGNQVYLPHKGWITVLGIKNIYEDWCKDKKDPLSHIPTNPEGMLDKNGGTRYIDGGNKQHNVGNNHPTVKPVALMRWLIRLVTPKNSKVLDPFTGSGSTGMAAVELGHEFIGCELDPNYVEIAQKRIEGWIQTKGEPTEPNLPRMCGPGGKDWVQSQSHQGNNPSNTFESIFEENK